jgi:hypothetical protein
MVLLQIYHIFHGYDFSCVQETPCLFLLAILIKFNLKFKEIRAITKSIIEPSNEMTAQSG